MEGDIGFMNDKNFQKLLDQTVDYGQKHQELLRRCKIEIERRFGIDYNASDCDSIIECLDYSSNKITLEQITEDIELSKSVGSARER